MLEEALETQKKTVEKLKILYGSTNVIDSGIKGAETIQRLLQTRHDGDASQITDYSRATIVARDFFEIYQYFKRLQKHFEIVSIDDHYLQPFAGGHRDLNVLFRDPVNKHLSENQINSRDVLEFARSKGYALFDEIRKLQALEVLERRKLTETEINRVKELTYMNREGCNQAFEKSLNNTRIGVYGICIKGGVVLMVKTISGSRVIYNFPGGGVEKNEGFAKSLQRECAEEIGCPVTIEALYHTSSKTYKHSDFPNEAFHLYYQVSLLGEIDPCLQEAQWVAIDKLPVEEMLEVDLEIAKKLQLHAQVSTEDK